MCFKRKIKKVNSQIRLEKKILFHDEKIIINRCREVEKWEFSNLKKIKFIKKIIIITDFFCIII